MPTNSSQVPGRRAFLVIDRLNGRLGNGTLFGDSPTAVTCFKDAIREHHASDIQPADLAKKLKDACSGGVYYYNDGWGFELWLKEPTEATALEGRD